MKIRKPSETAEAVAAARTLGTLLYGGEILDDPFAQHFLGPYYSTLYSALRLVRSRPLELGVEALYDWVLPGAIGWVLTRHRYFDDAIDAAVRGGAKQIVIVGAGYDSRAFRRTTLSDVRIFEVDHPDTQARKKRIVRALFGEMPKNVAYLGMNATSGDLRQLVRQGFDSEARAVFVLEGFLWYMPPEAARAILRAIVEVGAPGSQVIFDHILPSVVDGNCPLEGARETRRYCARRGEPILCGIEPEQLSSYLLELGLRLIDDTGQDTLRARYLGGCRRQPKIYPFLRIARAAVDSRPTGGPAAL